MSVVEIGVEVEDKRAEFKRLTGPTLDTKVVSMYSVKGYILRRVLKEMETRDLKDLCRYLGLKVSGNKEEIAKRIWLSDKIERVGFITNQ